MSWQPMKQPESLKIHSPCSLNSLLKIFTFIFSDDISDLVNIALLWPNIGINKNKINGHYQDVQALIHTVLP
jgi:hypothetical protein